MRSIAVLPVFLINPEVRFWHWFFLGDKDYCKNVYFSRASIVHDFAIWTLFVKNTWSRNVHCCFFNICTFVHAFSCVFRVLSDFCLHCFLPIRERYMLANILVDPWRKIDAREKYTFYSKLVQICQYQVFFINSIKPEKEITRQIVLSPLLNLTVDLGLFWCCSRWACVLRLFAMTKYRVFRYLVLPLHRPTRVLYKQIKYIVANWNNFLR